MEHQGTPEPGRPVLIVMRCDCGRSDCKRVMLVIANPVIRPLDIDPEALEPFGLGPNDLASVAYLPKEHIPALIEQLRMLGSE